MKRTCAQSEQAVEQERRQVEQLEQHGHGRQKPAGGDPTRGQLPGQSRVPQPRHAAPYLRPAARSEQWQQPERGTDGLTGGAESCGRGHPKEDGAEQHAEPKRQHT